MESLTDFLDSIEDDSKFKELVSQAPKIQELEKLITYVSKFHGGDDEKFLKDYINHVKQNNDMDSALACFRSLAKQSSPVKNRE